MTTNPTDIHLQSQLDAINELEEFDHSFLKPETVSRLTEPFGFKGGLYRATDNRSVFKGLTLSGINPETGKEFQEGDKAWGQDAHKLAEQICEHLGLKWSEKFGIGSELRECCRVAREHIESLL
jgi:hypothetical protein